MNTLWKIPKALLQLIEKRGANDRRTGDRRRGLLKLQSLFIGLFSRKDRRKGERRKKVRRDTNS